MTLRLLWKSAPRGQQSSQPKCPQPHDEAHERGLVTPRGQRCCCDSESCSCASTIDTAVAVAAAAVYTCILGAHAATAAIAAFAAVAAGTHNACVPGSSETTSQAVLRPSGVGNTEGKKHANPGWATLEALSIRGGTTNGRLLAYADAAFGIFAAPFVAPATSTEEAGSESIKPSRRH